MWILNKETGKKWFVSKEHAKKLLKEDHFSAVGEADASEVEELKNETPPSTDDTNLSELRAAAKEQGISGYTKMDKAQLEKALGDVNGAK